MRLLERLIVELGTTDTLLIKVNKHNFEKMPEVLQVVQKKLGELKNVRTEISEQIEGPGFIVEAASAIIDGSLENQINAIDKLFEVVERR
ncbi:MAG: hypothetical protein HQK53_14695 [Oligoflexia bacterium]|nr:hypothetical protein [Oligoflexia bacterium]